MPIRIVSNITIDPDDVEDYLAYWTVRCEECRAEPGCLQYDVARSIDAATPNQFVLLELWADQESYDAHWVAQTRTERPRFRRAPRAAGRDGLELYTDQQYYRLEHGRWVPEPTVTTATRGE